MSALDTPKQLQLAVRTIIADMQQVIVLLETMPGGLLPEDFDDLARSLGRTRHMVKEHALLDFYCLEFPLQGPPDKVAFVTVLKHLYDLLEAYPEAEHSLVLINDILKDLSAPASGSQRMDMRRRKRR